MKEILLYVLKLQDGRYYVGQSSNVDKRIIQHTKVKGAVWTKIYSPLALIECKQTRVKDQETATIKENILTLETMKRYGWRNVRGGWFCAIDELQLEKALRHHGLFDLVRGFKK